MEEKEMPKENEHIPFADLFGYVHRKRKKDIKRNWREIKYNPYVSANKNDPISKVNNIFSSNQEETPGLKKRIADQFENLQALSLKITKELTDQNIPLRSKIWKRLAFIIHNQNIPDQTLDDFLQNQLRNFWDAIDD